MAHAAVRSDGRLQRGPAAGRARTISTRPENQAQKQIQRIRTVHEALLACRCIAWWRSQSAWSRIHSCGDVFSRRDSRSAVSAVRPRFPTTSRSADCARSRTAPGLDLANPRGFIQKLELPLDDTVGVAATFSARRGLCVRRWYLACTDLPTRFNVPGVRSGWG